MPVAVALLAAAGLLLAIPVVTRLAARRKQAVPLARSRAVPEAPPVSARTAPPLPARTAPPLPARTAPPLPARTAPPRANPGPAAVPQVPSATPHAAKEEDAEAGAGAAPDSPLLDTPLLDTPLTVALTATNRGHVKVGTWVTLTAITPLTRGQSATLTLFYRLNLGRKIVYSFAQGGLCSTTWVAVVPGHYQFTAAALGGRRAAVSRSIEITVDRPLTPAPRRVAATPPVRAAPAGARPPAPETPRSAAEPAARPPVYHVVAARFAFSRNADVLAAALRESGYHAAVRRMADGRGKTAYVVETGTYRRPGEVFDAVTRLLRSGYPAYFFTGR